MVGRPRDGSEGLMLRDLKLRLKRYPSLVMIYRSLRPGFVVSDRWNTYFPKWRKAVLTPLGFQLVSSNYAANRAMQAGAFEVEETEVIRHHLSGADVFVDVGANIGLYTCLARSEGKHVIAIEPQLRNLECLYANLTLNGWRDSEVYPLGLGADYGLATLYGASGPSASLLAGWATLSQRFQQTIAVTTLDTLLGDRFDGKKLLVKIDVEGAEHRVLKGAERTIRMSPKPTWMIEICLNEYHPAGLNPDYSATFEMFWAQGYEARTADGQNRLVSPVDIREWIAARRSSLKVFNYIFTPIAT
jgi:FkbM family methyltransferase